MNAICDLRPLSPLRGYAPRATRSGGLRPRLPSAGPSARCRFGVGFGSPIEPSARITPSELGAESPTSRTTPPASIPAPLRGYAPSARRSGGLRPRLSSAVPLGLVRGVVGPRSAADPSGLFRYHTDVGVPIEPSALSCSVIRLGSAVEPVPLRKPESRTCRC